MNFFAFMLLSEMMRPTTGPVFHRPAPRREPLKISKEIWKLVKEGKISARYVMGDTYHIEPIVFNSSTI